MKTKNKKEFLESIAEITTPESSIHEFACDIERDAPTDAAQGRPPNSNPREKRKRYQWTLTCIGINLCAFLFGLDTTISGAVQASVYESSGELNKLPRIGIAFLMGSVAVILVLGRMFQTFEIKTLLLSSIFVFEVGSALCGAAPSVDVLTVGRVVACIGGCGMYKG